MKRIFIIFLTTLFLFTGCKKDIKKEKPDPIKGVWFSYNEIDKMLLSGEFKSEFVLAADNCLKLGITDVFVHLIPFCDSYYPSEIYPLRQSAQNADFDIVEYIIEICHQRNIRVHGWINPYRVRTADEDLSKLPTDSPANTLPKDAICFYNGIYLNPSSEESVKLIGLGIKEILDSYDIDGIHFDDYFYPTADPEFDKASYEEYLRNNQSALDLSEWRRVNVDMLVSSSKRLIKGERQEVIFSISPAASISNNYTNLSADIKGWVENGYVDWIMPQLYFGFNYPDEDFCFDNLLNEWKGVTDKSKIKLIIGLASYKVGTDTEYEAEEFRCGDLLKKQTEISFKNADGCCYFSYSSLFGENSLQAKERENLLNFFKNVSQ